MQILNCDILELKFIHTNKCGKDTVAAICRIHLIWFIIVIGYENAMYTVQWTVNFVWMMSIIMVAMGTLSKSTKNIRKKWYGCFDVQTSIQCRKWKIYTIDSDVVRTRMADKIYYTLENIILEKLIKR